MSLMKDLSPAIVAATVGVMASYSTVVPVEGQVTSSAHHQSQEDVELVNSIHALINRCQQEEREFLAAVKVAAELTSAEIRQRTPADQLVAFSEYLHKIRSLEVIMKGYQVPDQFADLHLRARKALAAYRSSASMLHMIMLQASSIPVIVPSNTSAEGLKMLAEHTTAAVVGLAKA